MPRNVNAHTNQMIHKHYHYHYYPEPQYDTFQNPEKSSANTSITPNKNNRYQTQADPIYMEDDYSNSWKKHINPQITKMYEEISINESLNDYQYNQNSYVIDRGNNENSKLPFNSKFKKNSKQALKQQIQKYQEYLRVRSQVNLYVPGTKSMINLRNFPSNYRESQVTNSQKQSKIQQMYRNNKQAQKNVIISRVQSDIKKPKQEFSTFFSNQISAIKNSKQQNQNYTEDLTGTLKNQRGQNWRQSRDNMVQTVERKIKSSQNLQSKAQKITNPGDFLFSSFNKKSFQNQLAESDKFYHYRLIQQQCNYLRDYFITHIEIHHHHANQPKQRTSINNNSDKP